MVRVVIYGERSEETEGLEVMLRTILTEKQQWPVIHTYIGDLESYLHFVRGNPYLIMLVCAMGEKGAQIVRKMREYDAVIVGDIPSHERNQIIKYGFAHAFGIFPPGKEQLEECLTDCLSNFFTKNLTFS